MYNRPYRYDGRANMTCNYSDIFYTQNNLQNNSPDYSIFENKFPLNYSINIPISMAKSVEGKYFIGYSDNLPFGQATNAWARLYNPEDSGVNIFIDLWTVTDISTIPFTAQIWFNTNPPGLIQTSDSVTPGNTTITPPSKPKAKLQYAVSTKGLPKGGTQAFIRRAPAATTLIGEVHGNYIFPPGGSYLILLRNPQKPTEFVSGSITFAWWEEPII